MTTYLLAGGGTAGHVNPMLAIAQRLRRDEPSCTILMLGTAEGLESRLVPEAGFELLTIAKVPFPRRLNRDAVRFLSRWRAAVAQVRHVLVQRQVDVVIGVGGYAAAPAYAAAHRERVPFAIHEANARPGLANRLGARWTRFVGIAIPGTAIQHGTLVGMPLRPEFEHVVTSAQKREARQSFGLQPDLPTLVITGGSLGSARLNETTTAVASEFGRAGVQILHITGRGRSVSITSGSVDTGDATSNAGDATSNSVEGGYRVLEYCDRMRDALACADLVISRAGASTVCEIAALGLPAVFVPYPVGNGEQRFNALPLVTTGGAQLVRDADFTPAWMLASVLPLMRDQARLATMGAASRELGIRNGAERMCALIQRARASLPASRELG